MRTFIMLDVCLQPSFPLISWLFNNVVNCNLDCIVWIKQNYNKYADHKWTLFHFELRTIVFKLSWFPSVMHSSHLSVSYYIGFTLAVKSKLKCFICTCVSSIHFCCILSHEMKSVNEVTESNSISTCQRNCLKFIQLVSLIVL